MILISIFYLALLDPGSTKTKKPFAPFLKVTTTQFGKYRNKQIVFQILLTDTNSLPRSCKNITSLIDPEMLYKKKDNNKVLRIFLCTLKRNFIYFILSLFSGYTLIHVKLQKLSISLNSKMEIKNASTVYFGEKAKCYKTVYHNL